MPSTCPNPSDRPTREEIYAGLDEWLKDRGSSPLDHDVAFIVEIDTTPPWIAEYYDVDDYEPWSHVPIVPFPLRAIAWSILIMVAIVAGVGWLFG